MNDLFTDTELECLREKYRWESELLTAPERERITAFVRGLPRSKQIQLRDCTPKIHWLSHIAWVVLNQK